MTTQDEFSPAFSSAFDAARPGECSWPVSYSACAECGPLDAATATERAAYEEMAVEYLRRWTRGLVGVCTVSVRPCAEPCPTGSVGSTFWGGGPYPGSTGPSTGMGPFQWGPALVGGLWYNISCGACGTVCGCGAPESLRLPGPIAAIDEVWIDGTLMDPAMYRVDNASLLVRLDGGRWPTCQDMAAPVTEPDTFEVVYEMGTPVPAGGQIAAGVLACEFAKAACGDPTCGLPQRVQTVSRQGVTVALLDSFDDLSNGATGIWLIDSWVASITRPPRPSMVRSVDIDPNRPRYRTTTWPR